MKYENTILGVFVRRINRFVAEVLINGKMETAERVCLYALLKKALDRPGKA